MEPPPLFHGSASGAGNIGGGGGSRVTGGLGTGDIDGTGGAPAHLTNMVGPCVGQTPRANWSVGFGRGDE